MKTESIKPIIEAASEILELTAKSGSSPVRGNKKIIFRRVSSFPSLVRLFGIKKTFSIILSGKTEVLNGIQLKEDSVVFPLGFNKGVVMASSGKNEVIKIVMGESEARKIGNEITAAKLLNGNMNLCPRLKKYDIHSNGYHWIIQELWPDSLPIKINEAREFASRELAEALYSTYGLTGIYSYSLPEWLNGLEEKASKELKRTTVYNGLKNKLINHPQANQVPILCSKVHGDLYLKHIHRNRIGWRIIDWGHFEEGNVLEDWLSLELKTERKRWYQESLISRLERSDTIDKINSTLFFDWPGPLLQKLYGQQINHPDCLKFLIYAALLERLVRAEDLIQVNPLEIDWLMTALDAPSSFK